METDQLLISKEATVAFVPTVTDKTRTEKVTTKAPPTATFLVVSWAVRRFFSSVLIEGTQRLVMIVAFLLLWEAAPRVGLVSPVFIPPASVVFKALAELATTGELLKHTTISLQRAFAGFAIAAILAVPLGFLVGWYKTFAKYSDPLLQIFRQLPTIALFPVLMLLFGFGEVPKIVLIAKASFWGIFLNTVTGVSNLNPLLVKSARSMGISPFGMFRKVVLPAAAPSIFAGLRLSGTVSLLILTATEMLGGNAGLGFLVFNSEMRFEIPRMYAAIVSFMILGLLVNYLLIGIEKRASKWKRQACYVRK